MMRGCRSGNALDGDSTPFDAFFSGDDSRQPWRPERPMNGYADWDARHRVNPDFRVLELGANGTGALECLKAENDDVETDRRNRNAPKPPDELRDVRWRPWADCRHLSARARPVADQEVGHSRPENLIEAPRRYAGPRPDRRWQAKEPGPGALNEAHQGCIWRRAAVTDARAVRADDFGSCIRALVLRKRIAPGDLRACGHCVADHKDRAAEDHPCGGCHPPMPPGVGQAALPPQANQQLMHSTGRFCERCGIRSRSVEGFLRPLLGSIPPRRSKIEERPCASFSCSSSR